MKQKKLLVSLAIVAVVSVFVLLALEALVRSPGDLLVGAHRHGQNDVSTSFIAYHSFPAAARQQFGEFPSWNPLKFGGAPFHGNPESGAYYPANWLVWLTDNVALLSWVIALHLLLGGLGVYLLGRGYGFRASAACTSAVIYAVAPFLLAQAAEGHYTLICAAAWAPWAFWAFERLRGGSQWAFLLLAGILAGSFFAGHAQTTYYLVLILTLLRAADLVKMMRGGQKQAAVNAGGQWALLGLAVAGLAAIDLVPIWVYAKYSVRGRGLGIAEAGAIHTGMTNLLQMVYPYALGDAATYRGPGKYFWETLCYFGVAPLLLAFVGAIVRRRRGFVRQWSIVAIAALLFSAGALGGLYPLSYYLLPGGAMFQAPSRMLLYTSLAVAVLAGAGVESIAQLVRVRRRHLGRTTPPPTLGVVGMIAVVAIHPRTRIPVGAILTGICGLELALFGSGLFAVMPREKLAEESSIVAFLNQEENRGRVSAPQRLLTDYEAWRAGIEKIQAFDPAVPALHASLAVQTADGVADIVMPREVLGFPAPSSKHQQKLWYDLMNVRFVVLAADTPSPSEEWRLVNRGKVVSRFADRNASEQNAGLDYAIYERPEVLPRAFVLGNVEATGSMKLALTNLAALKPTERLLIERDVLPSGERQAFAPAEIIEHAPDRVVVEATLDKPGYLYLGDAWLPGWSAEADGEEIAVQRANGAFRAVPLTAGRHTVVFQYQPGGFLIGRWLSLVSIACLVAWGLARWNKSRQTVGSR